MEEFMRRKKLFASMMAACFALTLLTGTALAQKTLKIGVLGPFTGPSAKTGEEFKGSVTMAFEKVQNKVGDYKLEPVWVDSQSDPAKAVSAYAEACERIGIQAGILNWHSSVAVAVMDVAAQYKVPHMFGFGATEVVNQKWRSDPKKFSYWNGKGWPVPGKLMAGYAETIDNAVKSGKYKPQAKAVAIACEDTDWGHSAGDAVASEFEKKGWKVVAKDYFPITQTDFYPLLGRYKKEKVSVLFSTSTAAPVTSAFIKQTREVGLKSLVIIDGLGWSGDWYNMAGAASDGVLDMIPQLTTQASKDWAVEFEKRFGMKPSPSAGGLSYDGASLFVKILQRTLEKYGKLDKETIHKVMVDEVDTGKLTYSKADGAMIMNEYRYTMETMPDPVVAQDAYFFPVIQYMGGVGKIVYPEDWAEAKFMAPK
jgi:branched-chain amino acid transport system substrate-binding protein